MKHPEWLYRIVFGLVALILPVIAWLFWLVDQIFK